MQLRLSVTAATTMILSFFAALPPSLFQSSSSFVIFGQRRVPRVAVSPSSYVLFQLQTRLNPSRSAVFHNRNATDGFQNPFHLFSSPSKTYDFFLSVSRVPDHDFMYGYNRLESDFDLNNVRGHSPCHPKYIKCSALLHAYYFLSLSVLPHTGFR